MITIYEEHIRAGEQIGDECYIKREYLQPDGKKMTYPARSQPPEGSVFIGIHENHKSKDPEKQGQWCGGWVGFSNVEGSDERSKHELVQAEPLTIAPSLLCRACGNHGFIQNGKWQPQP